MNAPLSSSTTLPLPRRSPRWYFTRSAVVWKRSAYAHEGETKREDDINAFVKTFYEETKRFHDRFDSRKSTATDVQSVLAVLDRAARIDQL